MVKSITSEAEFESLLSSPLIMIKFSATWCGPCKAIAPVIDRIESSYPKVSMTDVDVDKLSNIARRYQVTAMPTFVFLHNGSEVARVMGGELALIQKHLRELTALIPDFGAGNRVGGSHDSGRSTNLSINELREIRMRALNKSSSTTRPQQTTIQEESEKPVPPYTKADAKSALAGSADHWKMLQSFGKYVRLYVLTLLSVDAKGAAANL